MPDDEEPAHEDSNIEALKSLEEKLTGDRELLENPDFVVQLFEASPDAIVIVDRTGKIRLVNTGAELMFGYNRRELIGEQVEVLIPEEYREKHVDHRDQFFHDPHMRPMGLYSPHFVPQGKLEALKKDGTKFEIEVNLSPVVAPQGIFTIATIRRRDQFHEPGSS